MGRVRHTGADGATLVLAYTVKGKDAGGNTARLNHPPPRNQAGHKVNDAPDEPPQPNRNPPPPPPWRRSVMLGKGLEPVPLREEE